MPRIECFLRFAIALGVLGAPCASLAQSCANPIPITPVSPGSFSGTTCGATNYLPSVANGAISTFGPQVIYLQSDLSATYGYENITLQADPNTLSLYVCRSPCATYSSCVAVADVGAGGIADATIAPPREAYIVVGSSNGTCSAYSLTISVPLD